MPENLWFFGNSREETEVRKLRFRTPVSSDDAVDKLLPDPTTVKSNIL